MPISDCDVRDPRIRRTRQLLQGALRDLMQKKSFDEISVQDVTELATVNRATFYDHYADKYALLEAMVAGSFHSLLHERNIRYDGTCPSAASAIVLSVCDFLTLSHGSGAGCQRQSAFEPLIEAAIIAAIRRVLWEGLSKRSVPSDPSSEMIAATASWAIFGGVKQWFYTPDRCSADDIVPVILRLVLPLLSAASPSEPQ